MLVDNAEEYDVPASIEKPEMLKDVHTIEAFVDFVWGQAGYALQEQDHHEVAKWLIATDHTEGLQKIIWHKIDPLTLDLVLYMGSLHYCHIPKRTILTLNIEMEEYVMEHIKNPKDLAHKYRDEYYKDIEGINAFDVPSPADDAEPVDESEAALIASLTTTAAKKTQTWRSKAATSFTVEATAYRLTPCYNFTQQYWGHQRMESWLAALEFSESLKNILCKMVMDPTQAETVKKAQIDLKSSKITCAQRWGMLNKSAEHAKLCPGGCTQLCVIKICSGNANQTALGAENEAARTNRFRPMIVCPDWTHNALTVAPKKAEGKPGKAMMFIYLDIYYQERIIQWHYNQKWTTEEIITELKRPKYMGELSLIYRWRVAQGLTNPTMWDFPTEFDKEMSKMSHAIQAELTENVKKQKNADLIKMRLEALQMHGTVLQNSTGEKRLSLQTSGHMLKKARIGFASHVESGEGYHKYRPSPVHYEDYKPEWKEKEPDHAVLSPKGGKGKSDKAGGKGKSKGKGKGKGKGKSKGKPKSKTWDKPKDAWEDTYSTQSTW